MHRRSIYTFVAALTVVALGAIGCARAESESPGPEVEVLSRSDFTDTIGASFDITVGEHNQTVDITDPSQVVVVKITFGPGASAGWHTHPGPVIVSIASGEMTFVNAVDCVTRVYGAGEGFIEGGHGNIHTGYNASETEELVVYATFLEVPPDGGPSIPAADPGC